MDNIQSLYATIFPRLNLETWSKDSQFLPRGIGKQDMQKMHEKIIALL